MSTGHHNKVYSKVSLVFISAIVLLSALSIYASAAVFNGNVTLFDSALNSSSQFNISNQSANNVLGHIVLSNDSGKVIITTRSDAQILFFPHFSDDPTGTDFRTEVVFVPNSSFSDPVFGDGYASFNTFDLHVGDLLSMYLTGSDTYGALYIKEVNLGSNITFEYLYNDQAGNNTFGELTGCVQHTTPDNCFAEEAEQCVWEFGLCVPDHGFKEFQFAECAMLPQGACDGINDTTCMWNANSGSNGLCEQGPQFNFDYGYNCSAIINQTFCNNQGFTEGTNLCTWNGTQCLENATKTLQDLPEPPVFSCEASAVLNNEEACLNLSNIYFMPCGWNNQTNECGFGGFDFDRFEEFDDITNDDTCQMMGGTWRTETTFDPLTNQLTSENWCEFGVAPPTFDQGGGGTFLGNPNQVKDCNQDCFACEFNGSSTPPSQWFNTTVAQTQCEASNAGCFFREDSNAFNGQGWCEPAAGFGGFDCDSFCGDCNLQPNPQNACTNSPASCRWDNVTTSCIDQGTKGCSQDCLQCGDQTSCQSSLASGGCAWDATVGVCTPKAGAYEICFDGSDNDNNGKTDCADFKCSSDPFCGGGISDANNCFQYDQFAYGNGAEGNCTGAQGCSWFNDGFGFGFCGPESEGCWRNESLFSDQAACEAFGGGDTCTFFSEGTCQVNSTFLQLCSGQPGQGLCDATPGCQWNTQANFCDVQVIVSCEMNTTLQGDQNACAQAGCIWQGDQIGGGFEGGHFQNCVSPCGNPMINDAASCGNATNASQVFNSTSCQWFAGRCEPKDLIGGCIQNDGDITSCTENANCNWFESDFGGPLVSPMPGLSGISHVADVWLAVGLQQPFTTGSNYSRYVLHSYNWGNITLEMAGMFDNAATYNVSRLLCNTTRVVEYNWSNSTCTDGFCNTNTTVLCNGFQLDYFLNLTTQKATTAELEALWHVPFFELELDMETSNQNVTFLDSIDRGTVKVDGQLGEHYNESATALDGTNATRVRTSPGFCDSGLQQEFFEGMDNDPPLVVAGDEVGDTTLTGHDYTDLVGLGVKKTPEAYMYGMPVVDLAGSALCSGVPMQDQSLGSGQNESKYYLYLDTDGSSANGCSPADDSDLDGFEYLFKYVAQIGNDGRLSETTLTQRCSGNNWVASSVPFNTENTKSCGFIGGPIFAIDKDTLTSKDDVNTSTGWRAYATTAAQGGNTTNVTDVVGPGQADFKGIDQEIIDCTSTADQDNSQCTKFKQFGFFPGEFGPACIDNADNDGDGAVDCEDLDCAYDPFFCSGSFVAQADDDTSPTFVWTKINQKLPTALKFIFNTNEPSNGSVKYYYNDTTCATLNTTINDASLENAETHDDYRPHHVVDLDGLSANTTYFYKLTACDPTGNCAVSKCRNATTPTGHSNITFKIGIPPGWTVDIPSMNLSNYSAQYALRASTQYLDRMNITVNQTNSSFALWLIGVSIFEKQTLNLSRFLTGDGLLGIDANQYQNFKQKTGLKQAIVEIPTDSTSNTLQHCDDDGNNCQSVTDNVDCTFTATTARCEIPDAVGLGFSTYRATTITAAAVADTSSSGSGSGGGGGGAVVAGTTATVKTSRLWATVSAGETVTMDVSKEGISVSEIDVDVAQAVEQLKVTVGSFDSVPVKAKEFDGLAHQYLEIVAGNVQTEDISSAAISFSVPESWVSEQGANPEEIKLYRLVDDEWTILETTYRGNLGTDHSYRATTPGFSFFVIGVEQSEKSEVLDEEQSEEVQEQEETQDTVEQVNAQEAAQILEEQQQSVHNKDLIAGLWIAGATIILGVVLFFLKRLQK